MAYLRAQSDYTDQETQTAPPLGLAPREPPLHSRKDFANEGTQCELVAAKEFRQLQQEYSCLKQDYGKLVIARNIVEDKFRSSQKLMRRWRAFLGARDSEYWKQTTRNGTASSRTDVSNETRGFIRSSSAPAYVSLVRQAGPAWESEAVDPMAPPTAEYSDGGVHNNASHQALESTGGRGYQVINGLEDDKAATSDDTADTADTENTTAPKHPDDTERESLQLTSLPERVEDDSPILLSTRAVKRKRYRESSHTNAIVGLRHSIETLPGTAEKPVHIKSDQSSSSPLAVARFQHLDEHDSMDLDEVGSKTPTPRKRRRHDTVRLPFTICGPLSPTDGHEDKSDLLTENDTLSGEKGEKSLGHQSRDNSPSSILDEEACKRKGDQYAALLWAKQQEKRMQRRDLGSVEDSTTPRHVGDEPRRKRSFLFNQAVRNKRAQERIDDSFLSADMKSTEMVPKITIRHGQGEGFRQKTPETTLRLVGSRGKSTFNEPRNAQIVSAPILRPTDPNILPRTGDLVKRRAPPSGRRDRDCARVEVLAEDGEIKAESTARNRHRLSKAPEAEERLGSLLAQRQPDKPLLPPETPGLKSRTFSQNYAVTTFDRQVDGLTAKNAITSGASGAANQDSCEESNQTIIDLQGKSSIPCSITPRSTRPSATHFTTSAGSKSISPRRTTVVSQKGPLRTWPREILRREHFKPNPWHNSGYSYGYREVIRKHDERKCLPGCTRSDCCGDIVRKIIAIGGPLMADRSPLPSSTSEAPEKDDAVDHDLLEGYMGDNYRCWWTMTEKEKRIEWKNAQAWDFGRRYGRHKDNGRQTTPPGFWKVDMASTQEKKQQDEEAEMMEREVVEARWREAMRKGGAWVFADK